MQKQLILMTQPQTKKGEIGLWARVDRAKLPFGMVEVTWSLRDGVPQEQPGKLRRRPSLIV